MIRVKLYQNKNEKNETAFKKWYPRVVNDVSGLPWLASFALSSPLRSG